MLLAAIESDCCCTWIIVGIGAALIGAYAGFNYFTYVFADAVDFFG